MHDWVRNQLEELLKALDKNESTIESYQKETDRLRIENEEIKKVVAELRSIK